MQYVLAYTIFFIIGSACIAQMLYFSIQSGQWLDKLFKWQKGLDNLFSKKSLLEKPLGGCEICFKHWVIFFCFWVYYLFFKTSDIAWVTDSIMINIKPLYWITVCVINMFWYGLFVSCATYLSTLILYIMTDKKLNQGGNVL